MSSPRRSISCTHCMNMSLTFLIREVVETELRLYVVVPNIHRLNIGGSQTECLSITRHQLHGKLIRAHVSQREAKRGRERHESLGNLLLPSLLGVFVEIESGSFRLWVVLEDKESRFPVSGCRTFRIETKLKYSLDIIY